MSATATTHQDPVDTLSAANADAVPPVTWRRHWPRAGRRTSRCRRVVRSSGASPQWIGCSDWPGMPGSTRSRRSTSVHRTECPPHF